jgi:hypothetical protein
MTSNPADGDTGPRDASAGEPVDDSSGGADAPGAEIGITDGEPNTFEPEEDPDSQS